jgi:type VI secretion system protein ImpH
MEAAMGQTTDTLDYFRALEERPYDFDFFQALRHIECLFVDKPRIGRGLRPVDAPIRLGQEPSLAFAPAVLSAFEPATDTGPPRMAVNFFGLLGPNGPLPLHLTEYARERQLHAGDPTFVRFLDIFHHRFLEMFYRAWAQAQPTANMDRPEQDHFAVYVGSLIGLAGERMRRRDDVADYAKLYYVNALASQVRNRDGLAALLTDYFNVPVRVEEFVGRWMDLPERERTRLGAANDGTVLGRGAVLGARVWDRQSKIRLWLGPMSLEQYEEFLPGGLALSRLVAWMHHYVCFELEWDVRLMLIQSQTPKAVLGRNARLGCTTWLGTVRRPGVVAGLTLDAERCAGKGWAQTNKAVRH